MKVISVLWICLLGVQAEDVPGMHDQVDLLQTKLERKTGQEDEARASIEMYEQGEADALDVSLMQTQLLRNPKNLSEADRARHPPVALATSRRVSKRRVSAVDAISSLMMKDLYPLALEVMEAHYYKQTCARYIWTENFVQTAGKYLAVLGLSLLSVIIAVGLVTVTQPPAGEQQLTRSPSQEALQSVPLLPILMRFIGPCFVMTMINQTIVMPAAESKASDMDSDVAFSGLIIGAYGLGVVMSFPFFLYCAYRSYRLGMLMVGVTAIIGNLLYAFSSSPVAIIWARIFCGLEGGVVFMNQVIVQQLTQGDGLLKATALVILFPFIGLVLGPITSSVCQTFAPWAPPEVPPSLFMVSCALAYTIAVLAKFPDREQCFEQAYAAGLKRPNDEPDETQVLRGTKVAKDDKKDTLEVDRHTECCSQLSVLLLSSVNLSRMVQRLFWEAAALHLLAINYGLGIKKAGVLLTTALLGMLCLPLIVVPLKRRAGTVGGLRVMDLIELTGMLIMFRITALGMDRIAYFVVGSMLFYIGNMGQFGFLVPVRQELAIKSKWLLSIEGGAFAYSLFQSFGIFLGPVAARDIQQECDAQNIIPAFLLATWFMNFVCKEVSMHVLVKKKM